MIPQVEFEIEQLTVVLLREGPRRGSLEAGEIQRLLNDHLQFNIRLVGEGKLLTAGAILDTGPEPRATGIGFSRLAADELERVIAEDPSVRAGLESYRIVSYLLPKGSLSFGTEGGRQ